MYILCGDSRHVFIKKKRRYLCPHVVKLLDDGLVKWEELPQRYREHPYFNLDRTEEIVTGPPYPLYQTLQTALQGIFIILKYYLKTGGGLLSWVPLTALNVSRYLNFTPITRQRHFLENYDNFIINFCNLQARHTSQQRGCCGGGRVCQR